MIFPAALTICVLDSSFALFLFGPDDEANQVMMKLKAVPSFVKRFQLGASSRDITVATTAATRRSACSIIWLPALCESAASVISHIVESTHQRSNTSVVLLSGATYVPSDLAEGVDVVVSSCVNHCALIQNMVNGITHSRQGIDVHHLNDVVTGQQGRWYAALTEAKGSSRALYASTAALKLLETSQSNRAAISCFLLVISGNNIKISEKQDIRRRLISSSAANGFFLESHFDNELPGDPIQLTFLCLEQIPTRQVKPWLSATWRHTTM